MEEHDAGGEHGTPIWAVFGDLMSGLLGAFVLILVGVLGVQLELVSSLEAEIAKRQQEEQRRQALEKALAGPLASGRVTLNNGKIGISGNVLFALNSDHLQAEGRQVLKGLAPPIAAYLGATGQMLMVSGFTDDMPVRGSNRQFADNWELSAQRALTVTRTLIEEGVPADAIFAAAFGAQQPVAANSDAEGRARNRRVEMAPVPKSSQAAKEGNG
ncbi:OmpA family protein [Dechloromonas sp. ZS-1]|uniref:OmpA family protein n=1 Tax=Dechloromonas sp. ZS-1 TaxID=3138067 RepID=UPI0031FD9846